jgi:ADP-heptose:LPS heptosyltransferase
MRRTIRILAVGGIGDVLMLTPALRALKQANPRAFVKVFCLGRPQYEVLLFNPHVDRVKLVSGGAAVAWLRAAPLDFARLCLDHLTEPDTAERHFSTSNYGVFHPSILRGRHATEIIGETIGVKVTDRTIEVHLTETEEEKAKAIVRGYKYPVALHITSDCSENQNWALEKWRKLVLRNSRYNFIQLGLPNESRVEGALDLRGHLSIRESIAVLKHSRGFVGVVSALSQAANAVATPSVVLFGPSTPEVWSHSNHAVVTKRLRCSPCIDDTIGFQCPYGAPCMSDISVEEVEYALRKQLEV